MCKYLVSTFLFHWVNSFVHPNRRASHSANMEIVSLVGGILFSLSMGAAFSWFEGTNNLTGGFLFLAIVVLLSNLFCFVCFFVFSNYYLYGTCSGTSFLSPSLSITSSEFTPFGSGVKSVSEKTFSVFLNYGRRKNLLFQMIIFYHICYISELSRMIPK